MVSDPLAMNMSNTLGYLRSELKDSGKKKRGSFGKRMLEIGFIKKILPAVYNKIFSLYYSSGTRWLSKRHVLCRRIETTNNKQT